MINFPEEEEFFYQAKRKRKRTHKKSDHKHEYENYLIKNEGYHYYLVGACKHCGRIGIINRKDLGKFSDIRLFLRWIYAFYPGDSESFFLFCKDRYPVVEKPLKEILKKNNIRG